MGKLAPTRYAKTGTSRCEACGAYPKGRSGCWLGNMPPQCTRHMWAGCSYAQADTRPCLGGRSDWQRTARGVDSQTAEVPAVQNEPTADRGGARRRPLLRYKAAKIACFKKTIAYFKKTIAYLKKQAFILNNKRLYTGICGRLYALGCLRQKDRCFT